MSALPRASDKASARLNDGIIHSGRLAAALVVAVATWACVPAGHLRSEQAATPVFDPVAFFAGRTRGTGSLKIILHRRQRTLVLGSGVVRPDGSIVLDQEVRRGEDAPTDRTWRLQAVGRGRYRGTLTDAVGPVTGEVGGNRLHLSFAMKGGLRAQQWLYLEPGGQVARNRMVVTKFGLPVASLDETIAREPS